MGTSPLTSFQEIESEWEGVLSACPVNTLFLTPQWQQVWWDTFGSDKELAGFYLRSQSLNGGVAAVASLTQSGDTLALLGSQETVDYNDFMVRPGYEAPFFDTLLGRLDKQEWGKLRLDSLIETSPTLTYLPDLARQRGYSVQVEQEDTSSGIELPPTWDEYLSGLSRKDRHELRRKFRRLEALPNWRWYCITDQKEVDARLPDFISLMRMSRQEKSEYMAGERESFFHRITSRMAQLGLLRLYFLDIDDQAVAASLCFDYASSRLLYNSGYNPEFGYYSVGLLLNALCLRSAIEEGGGSGAAAGYRRISYFDFLRGSESYKHHLGGSPRNLYQMVVTRA